MVGSRRDSDADSFHSASQLDTHDPSVAYDAAHVEVRRRWLTEIIPRHPEAHVDPLLAPGRPGVTDALIARFIRAERNQGSANVVATTLARLAETAAFRRDFRCVDFHRRGMARRLFMHATNPGATVYFGDAGLRDPCGRPVLLGRISLMLEQDTKVAIDRARGDAMVPCTHLRAGVLVLERAVALAGCMSYILDLSPYPTAEMAVHAHSRYWNADGATDEAAAVRARMAPKGAVGPHLPEHEACAEGLPVLREALRIATQYYPESLHAVWFYNPGFWFSIAFSVFSAWLPAETRAKMHIVRKGEERAHFLAPGALDPSAVPRELGGTGPSLDGDRFLMRAVELYDTTATLHATEPVVADVLPPKAAPG